MKCEEILKKKLKKLFQNDLSFDDKTICSSKTNRSPSSSIENGGICTKFIKEGISKHNKSEGNEKYFSMVNKSIISSEEMSKYGPLSSGYIPIKLKVLNKKTRKNTLDFNKKVKRSQKFTTDTAKISNNVKIGKNVEESSKKNLINKISLQSNEDKNLVRSIQKFQKNKLEKMEDSKNKLWSDKTNRLLQNSDRYFTTENRAKNNVFQSEHINGDYFFTENNLIHNLLSVQNSFSLDKNYFTEESFTESSDYSNERHSDFDDDFNIQEHSDYDFENSSKDEDYVLPDIEEDLYIRNGIATKYEIDENLKISFDSETKELQIIELPADKIEKKCDIYEKELIYNVKNNIETNDESDSSCPQLIPINNDIYDISMNVSEFDSDECSEFYDNSSEASESLICSINNRVKDVVVEPFRMEPKVFLFDSDEINENFQLSKKNPNNKLNVSVVDNILKSSLVYNKPELDFNVLYTLKHKSVQSNSMNENFTLSEMKSIFYNGIDSKHVLVLLKHKIYIYGTIKLRVIAGSVDIFGYIPSVNETVELYSPRGDGFLNITPLKNKSNVDLNENLMKHKNIFLISELNSIIQNFDSKKDAILLFERNYLSKKIELLGKYMKENLFPSMNPLQIDRSYYASEFILRTIIYTKVNNEIIIDPKWKTININKATKLLAIGGKSVGKSTCLRYIVNKEIKKHKKILFIDLDIGQSEMFLPQTISATILDCPLLGPGYFFNLNTNKAIVYGDLNIVLAPERYLENIRELSKYCNENKEFENIPWVINSMGYNKGFGTELIAVICNFFRPTDVLQLQSSTPTKNFDYIMEKEILEKTTLNVFKERDLSVQIKSRRLEYLEDLNFNIIVMESILKNELKNNKKKEWELFSKDKRYAMLLVRLGTIFENTFDWLTDVKPYCCSLDDINFKVHSNDVLSEEDFLNIGNGNIIYLCNCKIEQKSLDCYGIGIVRAVDKMNRKMYLISSVPKENMHHVNCLSICNIPLPTSIVLNQGPKIKNIVPYAYNTQKLISTRAIKNFNTLNFK